MGREDEREIVGGVEREVGEEDRVTEPEGKR